MLFKEIHKDISRYLAEDCYCPNEVYSVDGLFYVLIMNDAESRLLDTFEKDGNKIYLVATTDNKNHPYLVTVWADDERVGNIERYELTEHNIHAITDYFLKGKEPVVLSESMRLGHEVEKVLSVADAVMVTVR